MLGNNSKAGYNVGTGFCQIPVRAQEEETDKKNGKKPCQDRENPGKDSNRI
jgi:hypothetical protein